MKKRIIDTANSLFQLFLFTNLFISAVATIMTYGTIHLFSLQLDLDFFILVFFSTLASYCLHWYYTSDIDLEGLRSRWNSKYKNLLLILFVLSLVVIGFVFLVRPRWILFFIPTAIATLIYTAPKLPIKIFKKLEGRALAKTFYLTSIWVYVTCILPIQVSAIEINMLVVFYIACQFLFIYLICLLFDYRDHKKDNFNFILINTNKHFNKLFQFISVVFLIMLSIFYIISSDTLTTLALLLSFLVIYLSLKKSINTQSDYWYYFVLDGCMMLPAFIHFVFLLLNI